MEEGSIRVAEKNREIWEVNENAKEAILSFFKYAQCDWLENYLSYDKVPLKFSTWKAEDFQKNKIRVTPGSVVRIGGFINTGVVLLDCFVNIGAYIDSDTMIDSFATIGSCAQIGKKCHISSGVVIGGVLEPINARPVIIEDGCFIGAQSAIVEGAIIRKEAVIAMGTRIGASTKIIERETGKIRKGEVPERAIVVPGTYKSRTITTESESFDLAVSCAIIVGYKEPGNEFLVNEILHKL